MGCCWGRLGLKPEECVPYVDYINESRPPTETEDYFLSLDLDLDEDDSILQTVSLSNSQLSGNH